MTTVTNDSYIATCEVCELFRKIAKVYAGKTVFAVLDNARYQKCAVTRELAEQLGINMVFIRKEVYINKVYKLVDIV